MPHVIGAASMDIFEAAREGDVERVRALVEQDAGLVHATDIYSETEEGQERPLMVAAGEAIWRWCGTSLMSAHISIIVEHTIARHLHEACNWGHTAVVVSHLLQRGADITAVTANGGMTTLMIAATRARNAIVRVLLEHAGSDVDAVDNDSETALHRAACDRGCAVVVKRLLEAGADPTLRGEDGSTALDAAANNGHPKSGNEVLQRARRLRDGASISSTGASQQQSPPCLT